MILNFPIRRMTNLVIPQEADSSIVMPPTIQPIIEFPGPSAGVLPFNAATPTIEQSSMMNIQHAQGPSAGAASTNLVKLASGLWRLTWKHSLRADFNAAPTAFSQSSIDVGGNTMILSILWPTTNIWTEQEGSCVLNLMSGSGNVNMTTQATGVAQNILAFTQWWFDRLG